MMKCEAYQCTKLAVVRASVVIHHTVSEEHRNGCAGEFRHAMYCLGYTYFYCGGCLEKETLARHLMVWEEM